MFYVIEDTLVDSIKLVPFLFLAYLAMEYLEHKTGEKTEAAIRKAGKWGPLIGSIAGTLPQCGFSAAASNLYAGRIISLGTLLAVYLSTSDEMLPILLSERIGLGLILRILLWKVVISLGIGFGVDWLLAGVRRKESAGICGGRTSEQGNTGNCGGRISEHGNIGKRSDRISEQGSVGSRSGRTSEHGRAGSYGDGGTGSPDAGAREHVHDLCQEGHCHCEKGIFRSACAHTLQIFGFVLLITFALNLLLHFGGENLLAGFLLNRPVMGPVFSALAGLIPNCAGSIIVTQLYLQGAMDFGAMMAGLMTSTGVGMLILCRVNHHRRENVMIIALVFTLGVITGILL